ncbi:MAG: hydroxyisourate hydrolase [Betaproteobacteria bacterium]
MAKLSTHVLDTLHGRPAAGVRIELYACDAEAATLVATARTNADGRTDRPLLEGAAVRRGRYRLVFHVGDYFRAAGVALPDPPFVDVVPVEFGIAEDGGSYHVPLVCTPWTYATYRGS